MKDVRVIFEGEGVLEKTGTDGVFKRPIEGARIISGPEMETDELIIDSGDHGTIYDVDSEDIVISQDGTIEFKAFDSKYVIRKATEDDDLANLNPEPENTEEQ